jgi:hypothetical protein
MAYCITVPPSPRSMWGPPAVFATSPSPCGWTVWPREYLRMMVGNDQRHKKSVRKDRYRTGLPGYHDPTAGIGGAAPASSALTLRLWLALFGLFTCTALAIWLYVIDVPSGFVVVLGVLAAIAVLDIAVVLRRKRRGEPG